MANNLKTAVSEVSEMADQINPELQEGPVAKAIEKQTGKIPSDIFLWTSVGAMAGALTLKILKKDHLALFIGQWAAPFLLLGIYNKLVKLEGHDQTDRGEAASSEEPSASASHGNRRERSKTERRKSYAY